ncbi:MAG: hypothetical protein HY822_04425 [Acidobacteria bacterium]|nr:hypothetical protein [Acidobacteriota bacterium]
MDLLLQAIEEARAEIRNQIAAEPNDAANRRQEAMKLVAFKLDGLAGHITSSRRLLNDLRTLRRLLLEER